MAWVEKRQSGWKACWRDESGRRRSKSCFPTKIGAQRYGSEQEARGRRGEVTVAGRTPAWSAWCEEWVKLRRVESRTARLDANRIDVHIRPRWGNVPIGRIRRADVQAWVNSMESSGMSAANVRRTYHTFSASMTAAVEYDRLAANPCTRIKLPTIGTRAERFYTPEEFWRVHHYLNEPWASMAVVLVGTGLRFGELAGLHRADVDLDAKRLTVRCVWDPDANSMRNYPKGKRPREVPLPDFVADALSEWFAEHPASGGCGIEHQGAGRTACRSPLAITHHGKPLSRDSALWVWRRAQQLAGVEHGRIHDLRHSCASWMVQAGVPLQTIQAVLGHRSVTTTEKYSHAGDQSAVVRRALDSVALGGR